MPVPVPVPLPVPLPVPVPVRMLSNVTIFPTKRKNRPQLRGVPGPHPLPALGRGIVVHRLRLRRVMLRLTPLVTAAAPVLLVLNLVTGFAWDIQTEAAMT